MKKYLFLIIIATVFLCKNLLAQQYDIKSFSLEEGLRQSEVFNLIQDSKKNIWLGTNGGLSRFNGKKFETLTKKDGLIDDHVLNVREDKFGNLWIITFAGIIKYDGKNFVSFPSDSLIPKMRASFFWENPKRKGEFLLWAWQDQNNQKLIYFDGKNMINFGKKHENILGKFINLRFRSSKEKAFFIDANGILIDFDGEKLQKSTYYDYPIFKDALTIRPFFEDNEGFVWIANQTDSLRIYRCKDKQAERFYFPTEITNLNFFIAQDSKKNIWVLANGTLFRYNGKKFDLRIGSENGMPNTQYNSMIIDHEDRIWMSTLGMGVLRYDGNLFTGFTNKDGLFSDIVRCFYRDSQNNFWISSLNALNKYDGKKMVSYPVLGQVNTRILKIEELEKNKYLLATDVGLLFFDGKNFTPANQAYGLPANVAIRYFLKEKDGIWFATINLGIAFFDGKTTKFYNQENDGISSNFTRYLFRDQQKNLWICTNLGIDKFDGIKMTNYTTENGLSFDLVLHGATDRFGRVWAGTFGGGLDYFANGKMLHLNTSNSNLSSDLIYSLINDWQGNLWIGTQAGVDKISFDKEGNIKKIRNYGKEEGFLGVENNGHAVLLDKDSSIWFGTIKGAYHYNPKAEMPNLNPPITRITQLDLFLRKIDWKSERYAFCCQSIDAWDNLPKDLILPYDSNSLSFHFEAVSYQSPKKIRFQWKLEGIDKTWSPESNKTEANYPNLPAGKYTFLVKSCNSEGIWNEEPAKFSFTITPPWWATFWAKSLFLSAFLGITFTGIRLRINAIKDQKKELERLVIEKTAEVVKQKDEILEKNVEMSLQREEIMSQNEFINNQNRDLNRKNKDITSSINYAKRIQEAMLPDREGILQAFPNSFVFFQPRDIVSGDFYWFTSIFENGIRIKNVIVAADCTGHGVPGAFMSMAGTAYLNQIVNFQGITEPNKILTELSKNIRKALRQELSENKDGMDISVCTVDILQNKLQYSGAKNPLVYIKNKEMFVVKADRFSVGGKHAKAHQEFSLHEIPLEKEQKTCFYIFTDGYEDQFGGLKPTKFMSKNLRKLFLEIHEKPCFEQEKILSRTLEDWTMGHRQIDDILVIGFEI
ncbi:MAG: hypothetical protein EAZ97_03540 [Bacteroidetes bacterium]|nr:MAG: hypothetical protein EAZ97_03540 [Bacteroidota bacterium]